MDSSSSISSSSSGSSVCCETGWVASPPVPSVTNWYIPGATETTLPGCLWNVELTQGAIVLVEGTAEGTVSSWTASVTPYVAGTYDIDITYSDGTEITGSLDYDGGVDVVTEFTLSCP